MKRSLTSRLIGYLALGLVSLAPLSLVAAEEKTVNVTVTAGVAAAPPVSITLHERHGHVTPCKGKCTHTGGGLIDVAQPSPDTVLVTMSGAVIANSEMKFDLEQCFEVTFDDPKLKHAKLLIEGRVIGVLRGGHKGSAEYSDASAGVMTFSATSRSRRWSRARNTTAIPPAPTRASSRYPASGEPGPNPAGYAGKPWLTAAPPPTARSRGLRDVHRPRAVQPG